MGAEEGEFAARPELHNVEEQSLVQVDRYQALFFKDNVTVYLGRLLVYDTFYVLSDVYYFQANAQAEAEPEQPALQLVKYGNEAQGPEDSMQIPRDNVKFWSNLRVDGAASLAIAKYQASLE